MIESPLGYNVSFPYTKDIRKIYLEITDDCNLNCIHCYRKNWDQVPRHMELDTFQAIEVNLEKLVNLEEMVLGGIGEPMVHPHFAAIVQRLGNYPLTLTTNGTLLHSDLFPVITKFINKIVVSIDGDDDIFQDIRNTPLESIINSIKALQSYKLEHHSLFPTIHFQFVATKKNFSSLKKVIDLSSEINVSKLIVSQISPTDCFNEQDRLYTLESDSKIEKEVDLLRNYGFRKGVIIDFPLFSLNTERQCNFMEQTSVYLTAEGDVVPCYRFSHHGKEWIFGREKEVLKHSYGNIHKENLLDIWNKNDYQKFRYHVDNNLVPSCMDCRFVSGCEYVKDTENDCYGLFPSCGDCLWNRGFVYCP